MLLVGALHLSRTTLVQWVGNRAGLNWHIDQVEWSFSDRSFELHGIQIDDDDWMANTDTIAFTGISWTKGVLRVDRIHLGKLDVTQTIPPLGEGGDIDVTSVFDWESVWTGALKGLDFHRLDWAEFCVGGLNSPEFKVGQGGCEGLTCNAQGIDFSMLEWAFVSGHIPSMEFPLQLEASSLRGSWSPQGWDVQTSTLSLPGLDFEGTLAWPEMAGRGQAKVTWENLPSWIHDFELQGWLDTLQLKSESTSLVWDLNDTLWTANADGPGWLSIWASGNANSWQGQAQIDRIPQTLKSAIPSDTLNLKATGNRNSMDLTLTGSPELDARVVAKAKTDWATWLTAPEAPELVQVFIDTWGPWVSDPSERVEATVEGDGDVIHLALGQPDFELPWSMKGVLEGHALDVTATAAEGAEATSPLAGSATLHLELDSADQIVSWQGHCQMADLNDAMTGHGHVRWSGPEPEWELNLIGQGARLLVDGHGVPKVPDMDAVLHRTEDALVWGDMRIRGELAPKSEWAAWLVPDVALLDTFSLAINMDSTEIQSQVTVPELLWSGVVVKGSELNATAHGGALTVNLLSKVLLDTLEEESLDIEAQLVGNDIWEASLILRDELHAPFIWKLKSEPTSIDKWECSILEWAVPTPGSVLNVEDTPLQWTATSENPFPPHLKFSGSSGELNIITELEDAGRATVKLDGTFDDLDDWTQLLDSALGLSRLEVEGSLVWEANHFPSTLLAFHGFDATYERVQLDNVDMGMSLHQGALNVFVDSKRRETNTSLTSQLTWQPFRPYAQPKLTASLTNLPIEWAQPWLDSTLVQLTGRLDADLQLEGSLQQPQIQGQGRVDSLRADVPNLGTHFGGHGTFQIGEGDVWLNNFSMHDALGNKVRMEGALVHDDFEDWNFDASIVETPTPLLLMNLPENENDVAFGQLVVGGSLDLFYWNGDLDIRGDLAAFEGTDLHLALLTEETEGWNSTVEFLQPPTAVVEEEAMPDEDELGMLIDLNLETKREAKITILTDPENDANIVGNTQGNLHVLMDDWEHMTLNGELDIVEGRYDLALGSLVRKTFVAKPGGRLFWNGAPYDGTLDLEAVYTTRANVQPLLGSGATQVQNEDVEVLLQLTGPMMTPNLTFDLATPQAPPLVSEALASALSDPSEKTSQAIALLSLQEFLPPQYNSLELGSNGLQDYSIDVVTSQLSQWLSRFNEDIDIGIRYDAQHTAAETPTTSQQDALQVALRASFLNDRLEVEGAVGSREITQEALGETHLQNVRVLYHLNEDKSLQLTGFSEAQSSATQTANTTSQGVGIRWHRSFNWKWPWAKEKAQD